MSAIAPEVEVSLRLSDEFRALVRAHRRGRADPRLGQVVMTDAAPIRVQSAPVREAESVAIGAVRLQRHGRRPLCFEGALAKRASTQDSGGGGPVWHELCAYLTSDPGRVVVSIAAHPRPGFELTLRPLALAEEADSVEACLGVLGAFDPGDAAPPPFSEAGGSAQWLLDSSSRHLALMAQAREDYLGVVRAFCGPTHPIVARLERRFGLATEGMSHESV